MVGQSGGEGAVFIVDPHFDVDVLLGPVEDASALLDQLIVQTLL